MGTFFEELFKEQHEHKYREVMAELQEEWLKDRDKHQERYEGVGIRSSQISALVMYLIKKGVL